jgi:hypothetical protein
MVIPTEETVEQLGRRRKLVESSVDGFRDEFTKVGGVIENYRRIQKKGICPTCESTVEEINLDAKLAGTHKEHTEAGSKAFVVIFFCDQGYAFMQKFCLVFSQPMNRQFLRVVLSHHHNATGQLKS